MSLPTFQTEDFALEHLQSRWTTLIDPVIDLPLVKGNFLKNVVLSSSSIINHGLGRKLQGWMLVRQRGNANIFDNQDTNSTPDRTLLLNSSSGISVDLYVF